MALSQQFHERAREIVARYPVARSALIMLLHEAQDEVGYVSSDVIREVAAILGLTPADVAGVSTFYTMFKRRHPGRYLVSLCTNPSCAILGSGESAARLGELVGDGDDVCSWEEVECLAYCSQAPAAQVNYRDVARLTAERAERLVTSLREGRELDDVLSELSRGGGGREAPGRVG